MIVEQVPAADLLQVYSGLESDEVTNGIMVDTTLHVVEEPSIIGVDLTGKDILLCGYLTLAVHKIQECLNYKVVTCKALILMNLLLSGGQKEQSQAQRTAWRQMKLQQLFLIWSLQTTFWTRSV